MNPPRKQSPPTTPSVESSRVLLKSTKEPAPTSSSLSWAPEVSIGSAKSVESAREGPDVGGVAALKLKKGKAYQALCKSNHVDLGRRSEKAEATHGNTRTVTSSRRHASMPQSCTGATTLGSETISPSAVIAQPIPPLSQAQLDIANDRRARAHAQGHLLPNPDSPPIIDFTQFEDTYRGPRSGTFEGLVPGTKTGQRSVSGGCHRPDTSPSATIKMKDRYPAFTLNRTSGGTAPLHPASTPAAVAVSTTGGLTLAPASARKPDPRRILNALEGMLGDEYKISDYLHPHELLGMHQLDQLDFEERDRARTTFIKTGKLRVQRGEKGVISVLGEPIRTAAIYSSAPVVLSGREHEIPIIVVNTVEELYRTGIYQANLFRHLPNRGRLMELINIYDSEEQAPGSVIRPRQPSNSSARRGREHAKSVHPGFGAMTSLHLESTPDVCALLTTYISSLREPILCRFLFNAIWDWCGVADELETEEQGHTGGTGYSASSSFAPRLSSIPLARTYTSPEDATRIATAQLLLHLLPSPHFSLLVYLLAFFSQVALVREENGVGVADLARMYGSRIFGGDKAAATKTNHSHTPRDGETMMRWFLRRWAALSDGLFDVLDEVSMGLFRRTQARRDSFGKDILSSWSSASSPSTFKGDEDEEDSIQLESDMTLEVGENEAEFQAEDEEESLLNSVTSIRNHAFGKARKRPTTPAAKATRASDYFSAGYDMANGTQSARSKLLRAHSISEKSLNELATNTDEDANDFVVLSATRHRADDTLAVNPPIHAPQGNQGQTVDTRLLQGLNQRQIDVDMSKSTICPPTHHHQVDSTQLNNESVPEITIDGTTPPNGSSLQKCHLTSLQHLLPGLDPTNDGAVAPTSSRWTSVANPTSRPDEVINITNAGCDVKEESLEIISQLKQENMTLHHSVLHLEAELAQLRRDIYTANSNGFRSAAASNMDELGCPTNALGELGEDRQSRSGSQNVEDTEAVQIVAEIRKLMAKN